MQNFTLAEFLAKATSMMAEVHHETQRALETAAELVEKEAKAEVGIYQGAAGSFVPWAELADATKDDRVRQGYSENEPGLRSGEMRDSYGHEVVMTGVASGHAIVGSAEDKAVWFELGTSRQPPRSVLGGAAVREGARVAEICGAGVVKALVGEQVVGGLLKID